GGRTAADGPEACRGNRARALCGRSRQTARPGADRRIGTRGTDRNDTGAPPARHRSWLPGPGCGRCGPRGLAHSAVRHPGGERRVDPTQLGEGFLGLREFALEHGDLLQAFFPAELERLPRCLAAVGRDHFLDLGEREPQLFRLENDDEPIGVLAPVAAMVTLAARAEQSATLVKAQRAQAYVEL